MKKSQRWGKWKHSRSSRYAGAGWHRSGSTLWRQVDTLCGPVLAELHCTVPEAGRLVGGSRRTTCAGEITFYQPSRQGKVMFRYDPTRPEGKRQVADRWAVVEDKSIAPRKNTHKVHVEDSVHPGELVPTALTRLHRKVRIEVDNEIAAYRRKCQQRYGQPPSYLLAHTGPKLYGEIRRTGTPEWRTLPPTDRDCVNDANCLWGQKCIKGKCR